jgi:hypothetical protein
MQMLTAQLFFAASASAAAAMDLTSEASSTCLVFMAMGVEYERVLSIRQRRRCITAQHHTAAPQIIGAILLRLTGRFLIKPKIPSPAGQVLQEINYE